MGLDHEQTTSAPNNQSANKALAIIEFLSYSKEPLRLADIAAGLNYNPSTALRFLNSLEQAGYICKDPDSLKYQMTFKICALAYHIRLNSGLVEVTMKPIKELSARLRECVCLAVAQNDMVVYLFSADGPYTMLKTTQRIGNTSPMHCTGVGKMILSEYSKEEVEKVIARIGMPRYTDHTLTTEEALLDELERIRRRGYAYDNEECEIGARCIAFPIRDYTGKIIASLSVTGPVIRITDEFIDRNFRTIQDTVNEISYRMGYHSMY